MCIVEGSGGTATPFDALRALQRNSDAAGRRQVARVNRETLLHLQRGVRDAETVPELPRRRGEERVLAAMARSDEVGAVRLKSSG